MWNEEEKEKRARFTSQGQKTKGGASRFCAWELAGQHSSSFQKVGEKGELRHGIVSD